MKSRLNRVLVDTNLATISYFGWCHRWCRSRDWRQTGRRAQEVARPKSRRVKMPNGAGSIVLRSDGRWMARYSPEDPQTGRTLRKTLYGRTEQEARTKLVIALSGRELGTLVVSRGRTLSVRVYLERWLATKRARPKTLLRYRQLIVSHVIPTLGHLALPKLDPRHVNRLLTMKLSIGLAARTCNHIRAVLRNALHDAMREGLVTRNAAELAHPIPLHNIEETKVLSPEEVPIFLEVGQRHPLGNLWIVALASGCRQGELLGLRWQDVDLENCSIHIERTLQYLGGGWHVLPPKTARSRRPIALPKVACEALRRERKQQTEAHLKAESWGDEFGDLVFTDDRGGPLTAYRLSPQLQRELARAGLPPLRFHDLRHSTASLLAFAGVPARVAMEVLGHRQISTTMDIYTKVYPEVRREAAEALDKVLGPRLAE
jgi:integrase